MIESILTSMKKVTSGLVEEDTSFDDDFVMHINSIFAELAQLGVGPEDGFQIEDKTTTWHDFIGDDKTLNMVQSYMAGKLRLIFDPPTIGAVAQAIEKNVEEFSWRLREQASYNSRKGSDQNESD